MAHRSNPSALRWLIGVELAYYRHRAGLTLAALQDRTQISKPQLSHLETGERRQYPVDIAKVLTACRVARPDIDRLTSLASLPDTTTWWGVWSDVVPHWFRTFLGLERLAVTEFAFEPMAPPGLLQTPDYARVLTQDAPRVRRDHTERVIEVRMERARRLTDTQNPLRLRAVITEQALRLKVGTPEVMRAQYEHLIALAALPNVTVQVVTPECGPQSAVAGQFVVLDFAIAQSIGYAEGQDGAVYVQHPGEVDTYRDAARSLQVVAMPPKDSIAFITDLIKKL